MLGIPSIMAYKIDPFHSPRPAGPYFSGKVRSAAGSLPVFPVPISEPRNVVEVPDMSLEEFVDTGIAMGAAAFYAWSCCLADSIPVNRFDLDRLGALGRTVGIIEQAARILKVTGSGVDGIAEELQERYPVASMQPGSRGWGEELPSLLDEPGAYVVGFAVHGVVHVATLPDEAAIMRAFMQYMADKKWWDANHARLEAQKSAIIKKLARKVGKEPNVSYLDLELSPALTHELARLACRAPEG